MSLPVSIGDAYLLSKLAFKVGYALSAGRKAAVAEIQEVQNQLFALSEALNSAGEVEKQALSSPQALETFCKMIANCQLTLNHLQTLMERYEDTASAEAESLRLKETVIRNWKKVKWTTKGGDISDLREALATHISAIDLTLSALNTTQSGRIRCQTESLLHMVEEMYSSWKHGQQQTNARPNQAGAMPSTLPRATILVRREGLADTELVCPRALIQIECIDEYSIEGAKLFECTCQESKPHTDELCLTVQDTSILIRNPAQKPEWEIQMYSELLGRAVQVIVSNLSPSQLGRFESFANGLALRQGVNLSRQGRCSNLAFIRPRDCSEGRVDELFVLKMQPSISQFDGHINKVVFESCTSGTRLPLDDFSSANLFHYLSFFIDDEDKNGKDNRHIGLVLVASTGSHGQGSASHFTVQIEYLSQVDLNTNRGVLFIDNVVCIEHAESATKLEANVELSFDSVEVAQAFERCLRLMQAELFVSYLRKPRVRERILFEQTLGDCKISDFFLLGAKAKGIRDEVTGEERVIVENDSRALSVCIRSPDILSQNGLSVSSDSQLVVVQISADRTSIIPLSNDANFVQARRT